LLRATRLAGYPNPYSQGSESSFYRGIQRTLIIFQTRSQLPRNIYDVIFYKEVIPVGPPIPLKVKPELSCSS